MGGLNVKNTIVERVLQIIAPHYCFGCGKVGALLCDYCKYDIENEPFIGCIACGYTSREGICSIHESPISQSFIVSQRSGPLEAIIDGLKFHNVKAAARIVAELLDERLPILPENTVIVPIPTVRSHIRQRGYDQVELIARHLASLRKLPLQPLLKRVGNTTQHTLTKEERHKAAQQAFTLNTAVTLPKGTPLLVIDDIVTTGATVLSAANILSELNSPIWVSAGAYQPLD